MKFKTVIILTAFLAASGQFANTIFVPAISMMAHSLNVTPSSLQGLIAAYLTPYGISQFIYGPAADRYGRKPVIYFGVIVFAAGALTSFLGPNFSIIMLGCISQGIGAGVGGVMVRTIMRDCFEGETLQKANSYMTMAVVFAPLLAPVTGGFLSVKFGWRTVFLFLFIFAMLVLIQQIYFMKETNPDNRKISVMERYKILFREKSFFFYVTYLMLAFSGIAVFEASFGVLFGNVFKLTPAITSLLFIVPIPFFLIGSFYAGKAIKNNSLDKIIVISIIIIMISSLSLYATAYFKILTISAILIPICSFMFGTGILCPTATTAALKPLGNIAGTAGSFLGGYQNIGAGLFTFLSALIPQISQKPLALTLCAITAIMISVLIAQKVTRKYPAKRKVIYPQEFL